MDCEVVTLSNGKEYSLLLEKIKDDKTYYLAELSGDDEINGDSIFFEKVVKDDKEFLKIVQDKTLIEELLVLFTADFIKLTEKMGENK